MSFHETAREVRIEDDYVLVAELRNDNGDYVTARLNLNEVLGNFNGMSLVMLLSRHIFKAVS